LPYACLKLTMHCPFQGFSGTTAFGTLPRLLE
jgi:hypothetical protein